MSGSDASPRRGARTNPPLSGSRPESSFLRLVLGSTAGRSRHRQASACLSDIIHMASGAALSSTPQQPQAENTRADTFPHAPCYMQDPATQAASQDGSAKRGEFAICSQRLSLPVVS